MPGRWLRRWKPWRRRERGRRRAGRTKKAVRRFATNRLGAYSERESNPYGHCWPQDFKSGVSTYSTIRATASPAGSNCKITKKTRHCQIAVCRRRKIVRPAVRLWGRGVGRCGRACPINTRRRSCRRPRSRKSRSSYRRRSNLRRRCGFWRGRTGRGPRPGRRSRAGKKRRFRPRRPL